MRPAAMSYSPWAMRRAPRADREGSAVPPGDARRHGHQTRHRELPVRRTHRGAPAYREGPASFPVTSPEMDDEVSELPLVATHRVVSFVRITEAAPAQHPAAPPPPSP